MLARTPTLSLIVPTRGRPRQLRRFLRSLAATVLRPSRVEVVLVVDADDPEAVRRFAGQMRKEATRLSALVHEIIELSRLQVAGALEEISAIDIDAVIAESVDRARTNASAKHMVFDVGGASGAVVFGDHGLLVTAVRNLLDNAVKFGEGKPITLQLSRAGKWIHLKVRDQGRGVAKRDQRRIFEKFERAISATHAGGLGIGLYLVRQIVEAHRGRVDVESLEGQGSCFSVILPCAEPPLSINA